VPSEYVGVASGVEFSCVYGPLGFELRYTKYPVTVELLRSQASATVCFAAAVTPLPESAMFMGEFAALLVIVSVPATLPVALGSKFTVYASDCVGSRVKPVAELPKTNPVPFTVTFEMLAFVFPVLFTVS